MQQTMALRNIVDVGSRANHTVRKTRVGIYANLRLHLEVLLVSLLGLLHLRIALAVLVLRRAERGNQCGIKH